MAHVQDEKAGLGQTKERILDLLLSGSKSAGDIANSLKIQKSAARVHLESLKSQGAAKSKFQIEKMGRPRKVYELTEQGRELFPRHYDLFLGLVLDKLASRKGESEARKTVEAVAEDIAQGIRERIDKSRSAGNLEQSLKIINDVSNELGFASSLSREEKDGSSFCIKSRNCILHRVAANNQDLVCHGIHDKIISKSLAAGNSGVMVELKECLALGNDYCRHTIRSPRAK